MAQFETVNGAELLSIDTPSGRRYLDPRVVVYRASDLRVLIATTVGLRALDEGEAEMVRLLDLPAGAIVLVGAAL